MKYVIAQSSRLAPYVTTRVGAKPCSSIHAVVKDSSEGQGCEEPGGRRERWHFEGRTAQERSASRRSVVRRIRSRRAADGVTRHER